MTEARVKPIKLVESTVNAGVWCVPLSNADGSPVGSNLADIGVTASPAELNALDGITATVSELNALDGITADVGELNLNDGAQAGVAVASVTLVAGAAKELPTGLVENVVTKNADYPCVAGDSGKVIVVTGVDKVMTLPATVLGLRYVFILAAAGLSAGAGLKISPNAADQIIGNGFTPADDKDAILAGSGDRAGDMIELVGDGNLGWYITRVIGTWTRE